MLKNQKQTIEKEREEKRLTETTNCSLFSCVDGGCKKVFERKREKIGEKGGKRGEFGAWYLAPKPGRFFKNGP